MFIKICFTLVLFKSLVIATENVQEDYKQIRFYLFTKTIEPRTTSDSGQKEIIISDVNSLKSSGFIKGASTTILIHGWKGGFNHTFPRVVRNAYLNSTFVASPLNIIEVDWAPLADRHSYVTAANNVRRVAKTVARFIQFLLSQNLTTSDKLHLVGHSLGAHVSGIAGLRLQEMEGFHKTKRITGLDPAKPLFEFVKTNERLDLNSADFVDVIHTSGASLGLLRSLGTADFYPNGGLTQPGCGADIHCDHARSYLYYAESISNPSGFKSCKCKSLLSEMHLKGCSCGTSGKIFMGEFVLPSAQGSFQLKTNSRPPFAQN